MSPSEKPTLTELMKAGPSVHSLLTASVFPNKLYRRTDTYKTKPCESQQLLKPIKGHVFDSSSS